jgi:hypothetical protein
MFTLQTSLKSLAQESLVEVTVNSKEENSQDFCSIPYPRARIRDPSETRKSGYKNLLFSFFCSHNAQNCIYSILIFEQAQINV